MNRTVKTIAAAVLTLGLAFASSPIAAFGGFTTIQSGGGTGCCKQ